MIPNQKGFSLTELMVVVAVIGIMASFAIPQYQRYQSRARQQEAMNLLSGYFTAAQSAFTELGKYPGNFVSTSYAPSGVIHYQITVADNSGTLPAGAPIDTACIVTSDACDGGPAGFKNWSEETVNPAFKVTAATTTSATTDTTFTAVASAIIKPAGTLDEWTVNQGKVFNNTESGL